jgi:hypothetical protein
VALVAAGRKSPRKRTVQLANRIEISARELAKRLHEEAERAAERAEVTELEKKLAAAKARLKDRRRELGLPGGERAAGVLACPTCGEQFDTAQKCGVHRRWKHNYRRPT